MNKPPRIWISNGTPKKGETVRARAQIEHPMESGLRRDEAGAIRPRHIVTRFEASLGTTLLFAWEPGITVSPNPYIEFTFVARESGELKLGWKDDAGQTLNASRTLNVS